MTNPIETFVLLVLAAACTFVAVSIGQDAVPTYPLVHSEPVQYCHSRSLGGMFVPCRYVKWEGTA